ncbi:hypothetical protein COV19_02760 [Candidatus Woesearchaeota archaeon CG10_big_fil_rev_8_21_14_0_10_44_13]|nr:MAG: hypothetical protein COV19_02760 [Candidatus Woesearchaeota archaeon CG10_big_fil_rev_8_21_14_0_10_44_13]
MYKNLLRKIGLTDGETKVYLALLEHGPSTVGPIVKTSGIAYSNIYEVLQRLAEKGIVSYVTKQKTKYYQAYDPEKLMEYVEKQQKKIEEEKAELKKILPGLKRLSEETGEKLEAEVFVGMKGAFSAFSKMAAYWGADDEYLWLYNHEPETHGLTEVTDTFFLKLEPLYRKMGHRIRGISQPDYKKDSKTAKTLEKFAQIRYLNTPLPANVDIVKDRVMFISWSTKPVAFLIHSKDMADKFKLYFEGLWKIAKP